MAVMACWILHTGCKLQPITPNVADPPAASVNSFLILPKLSLLGLFQGC